MNLIVIIVYNRLNNLNHWLHCWKQCTSSAQLVVIHNSDGETYTVPEGVIYIKRKNIGFDIGAFQDVCSNRLPGFPEWDNLLWITDDTFPMVKNFDHAFWKQLNQGAGISCMEISPYVRRHIRTTGFAIKKELAYKLTFPADPVKTKEDCYKFEHRSIDNHLLTQATRLGYKVLQVALSTHSPLFDTGYGRRIRTREAQHYALFGNGQPKPIEEKPKVNPLVVFICPIYNNYPQIVSSLLCQTYTNWELHLIHDGPGKVDLPDDPRIHYEETETRAGNWGHSIRAEWLQKVTGDFVCITNPDNYLTPVFIQYMLKGFVNGTVATYCSEMTHSYKAWQTIPCRLQRGYLDCSGVMIKLSVAKEIGWLDITSHSADWVFFERIIKAKGNHSFTKVIGNLLVHN